MVRGTRCAVLGSPVAHSLSPALHRAAYRELGLDWTYDAIDIDSQDLAGFVAGLGPEWRGLSLTMPLKRAVMPLVDTADEWASAAGAANTLVLESGRLAGHNTDVPGAMAAIRERYDGPLDTAVVLGGGATAASLLLALGALGCPSARLLVRNPSRAEETVAVVAQAGGPAVEVGPLAEEFGAVDLLASTIPVAAQASSLVASASSARVVFDVVYDPWPTPLAAAASVLVSGLDLLAHQAALQVSLMTGSSVDAQVLRRAGEIELARRDG